MITGETPLDRKFRGDSKHPNQNLSTTQSTCNQCSEGLVVYYTEYGESRCQNCNTPL
jgi:hypothetical protein